MPAWLLQAMKTQMPSELIHMTDAALRRFVLNPTDDHISNVHPKRLAEFLHCVQQIFFDSFHSTEC